MLIEYRYSPHTIALVELLLEVVGYDTVWILNDNDQDPINKPQEAFWSSERDGLGSLQKKLQKRAGKAHADITLGFENVHVCFDRMFSA